jgi:hypothetical protein
VYKSAGTEETGLKRHGGKSLPESLFRQFDPQPGTRSPALYRKSACACGGGCPTCQMGQTGQIGQADPEGMAKNNELKVSQPNDPAEIEADRIADKVMQASSAEAGYGAPVSLPAVSAPRESLTAHFSARFGGEASTAGRDARAPSGSALDNSTRTFFEPRLNYDLGGVRVHTGDEAAASARSINAAAYTYGQDIYFAAGQYDPHSFSGKKLLAHELAHTVQQGTGSVARKIQRQPAPGAAPAKPANPAPAAPAYGNACSGGATDPCQPGRCAEPAANIMADLTRAIGYVDSAIAALGNSPVSDDVKRGFDWYFHSHSDETIAAVRATTACIKRELQDTYDNKRFGCHPDDPNLAYVCVGDIKPCESKKTNVCLTDLYFTRSDRVRAEVLIHECGHRAGLSVGNNPDIYDFTFSYMFMDTADSLINTDSYTIFLSSISQGFRTTLFGFPFGLGLSGGPAISTAGVSTWNARIYLGTEIQNPVLGIFNPTLGLGISLIGEAAAPGDPSLKFNPSALISLAGGFRLTDPRPGAAGGGFASFFGGPALAIGGKGKNGIGAEAGMAVGYRWKWLDVSAGVNYAYDPTRAAGLDHLFIPNISIDFNPVFSHFPFSH